MNIGFILQARIGSSRLKGKVLMKVDQEKTVIESVISQLKFSKKVKKIIVATTNKKEDEQIIEKIKEQGVEIFCGNENDVLDRYFQCAKKFTLTAIVRITCDNPLIDPIIVDNAVEKFESGNFDCVTNVRPRTFPEGTEVEIFSFNALKKAFFEANSKSEREHVTPYFYNNPDKFNIFNLNNTENLSHLRWTVDKEEDLKLICKIKEEITKSPILMKDILELFRKKPELVEINKNI
jgi:spore coat polysaccharide biosynthesis protein SpsF